MSQVTLQYNCLADPYITVSATLIISKKTDSATHIVLKTVAGSWDPAVNHHLKTLVSVSVKCGITTPEHWVRGTF